MDSTAPVESVQMSLLGSSNLASLGLDGQVKPRGQNGDVAVLGRTAFVAAGPIFHGASSTTGRICTDHGGVKVVDLTNPVTPTVVSTITMEDTKGVTTRGGVKLNNVSVTASAVDARTVSTPTFTGDVLAIATQRCEPSFFNGARVEFWDVTNRAAPVVLGYFDPVNLLNPTPGATPANGQWGIFEDVRMFVKGGRLMAVATTPFSIGNAHDASPFGDMRVLDLNDVRNPQQVATFPPVNVGQDSVNGCRSFQAGKAAAPTPDGNGAILSWYDGSQEFSPSQTAAVFKLDLNNMPVALPADPNDPTAPPQFNPTPPFWGYPLNPTVEGNAADVQPFNDDAGNLQVLMSEDDLDPAISNVTISAPGGTSQQFSSRSCTILAGKHAYEYPNQQVAGDLVYVGRACPASPLSPPLNTVPEELLADPNGKIAVMEGGGNQFDGCSAAEKVERLRQAGAIAVYQNAGADVGLNTLIAGPRGGIPAIPVLTITQSAYNNVQLVPSPVMPSTAFPATWTRSTTSNVTGVAFTGRPDKGRIKSVADATDRVARAQVADVNRFSVVAGATYQADASLEVEAISGGAFRAAVVWYNANGAAVSESQIASLSAVTPRTRFSTPVTAPVNAVKGAVKVEWTGAAAAGTAYADTFALARTGLQSSIKDNQGEWGAQRVLNFSATPPTEVGTYRSPTSKMWPPPDDGLYTPRQARMFGNKLAFSTWMSDGLRVLDVSNPATPREVGSFVPPKVADPTPEAGAGLGLTRGPVWGTKRLVTGVGVIPTGDSSGIVVVSDINAGIYVLGFQLQRSGQVAPNGTATALPGEQVEIVGTGFLPGATVQLSLGGTNVGTATADASGSVSTTVTVPNDLRSGSYPLQASGPGPGGATNLVFNVLVPAMGYWTVASDGGVFAFGRARFLGSMGGQPLDQPVVGMAATPSGNGYWLVAADGGLFAFGDAGFYGSTGGIALDKPVVGMAPTPSGEGYWLVASDGGLFAFGNAPFYGSTGGIALASPVVGMAASISGDGYRLVAADGGVFSFGNAPFHGSMGGTPLHGPVVGMATAPQGSGYWLLASDGGIFSFGSAEFSGSVGGVQLAAPMVGMAVKPPRGSGGP